MSAWLPRFCRKVPSYSFVVEFPKGDTLVLNLIRRGIDTFRGTLERTGARYQKGLSFVRAKLWAAPLTLGATFLSFPKTFVL